MSDRTQPEPWIDYVDQAQCPTCTRPLEPTDEATMVALGIPSDRALCHCDHCPPDDAGNMPAYEVTWTSEMRNDEEGYRIDVRVETARLIGHWDEDGGLWPTDAYRAEVRLRRMDVLRTRAKRAERVWRRWESIYATMTRPKWSEDRVTKNRTRYHDATEELVDLCLEAAR